MAKSKSKKARIQPNPELQYPVAAPGSISAPSMPVSHLPISSPPAADPPKRVEAPGLKQTPSLSTTNVAYLPSRDLPPGLPQPELPKTAASSQNIPSPLPLPAPVPVQAHPSAASTSTNVLEHSHKNKLQEYAQRSSLPLPIYYVINEGSPHAPKFRATVLIEGEEYTSPNTFSHRKEAEQDVAKLALERISERVREEGCPLILEDTVFCKSILHEFAVKMNMQLPTYDTVQPQRLLPVFASSLVFNGVTYSGGTGRNKKEAEQLAARASIISLLGDSGLGTILSEIIKSKVKLYAALDKVKDPNSAQHDTLRIAMNIGHVSKSTSIDNRAPAAAINVPICSTAQSPSVMYLPHHELNVSKPEQSSAAVNPPIEVVSPVLGQSSDAGPGSSKKQRKSKKKSQKKFRVDAQ
uniref:Uncharacterized protein MANES_01G116100 n=1 Tax=Rhizophora mucronata TaxID=61149 RepID=A0A2P2PKW9_RHIMU